MKKLSQKVVIFKFVGVYLYVCGHFYSRVFKAIVFKYLNI